MKLYEIAEDLTAEIENAEELQGLFENKLEAVIKVIKNAEAQATAIDNEIKALTQRKNAKKQTVERLKNYIFSCMQRTGQKKIDLPCGVLSVRKTPAKLVFDDVEAFVDQFCDNEDLVKLVPQIEKATIKQILREGDVLPHCHLEQGECLTLK